MKSENEKIAVVGLGYVGLPVAVALARKFSHVTGFDISERRIEALQRNEDWTHEVGKDELAGSTLKFTDYAADLSGTTFFIVTVPTPIDAQRRPDLSPLESACKLIGPNLKKGGVVVFESTVYPGVTEDFCAPLLAKASGLTFGTDFTVGYSPERINPGDKEHRLHNITKIIAASDQPTLARLKHVYGAIIEAGLYHATSIKVAEAAKVLENTQRDINIALMNELSIIMDRMGVRTKDVLDAAGTKWNFLKFSPGLVGGHCIGVDPYYLTSAAEALGYNPEVILSGRRLNDDMGRFVANRTIKLMAQRGIDFGSAKVGVLGLTFKENVPDLRNSKVPDIIAELGQFAIKPLVHDPLAPAAMAAHEYGIKLSELAEFAALDVLILAVNHATYVKDMPTIIKMLKPNGVLIDVKAVVSPEKLPQGIGYWSL